MKTGSMLLATHWATQARGTDGVDGTTRPMASLLVRVGGMNAPARIKTRRGADGSGAARTVVIVVVKDVDRGVHRSS